MMVVGGDGDPAMGVVHNVRAAGILVWRLSVEPKDQRSDKAPFAGERRHEMEREIGATVPDHLHAVFELPCSIEHWQL